MTGKNTIIEIGRPTDISNYRTVNRSLSRSYISVPSSHGTECNVHHTNFGDIGNRIDGAISLLFRTAREFELITLSVGGLNEYLFGKK